jgi:hypothetical protein
MLVGSDVLIATSLLATIVGIARVLLCEFLFVNGFHRVAEWSLPAAAIAAVLAGLIWCLVRFVTLSWRPYMHLRTIASRCGAVFFIFYCDGDAARRALPPLCPRRRRAAVLVRC